MESLDFAKKAIRHVWAEFIKHFNAAANVDLLFPKEIIDFPTMDLLKNAKSTNEANQAFLYHLMNNATVESLWKLCELLRDTARDHQRHNSLAKLLEDKLKQFTLTQPGEAEGQHVDYYPAAQSMTMEEGESAVKPVLSTLWSYLYSSLPPNEDFIIQLEIDGNIPRSDATKLRASAKLGGRACIHDLITFMYDFFDEPALETFCALLDKYGQSARPLMLEVAARIREEMGPLKPPQIHELAPENPQREGTSKLRADVEKGAFTVDIKERRVVHSVDKHSLLSSLAEYKTINEADLRTQVQQMEKDLSLKKEELRRVVEGELKVSRKGKGKAVTTDREHSLLSSLAEYKTLNEDLQTKVQQLEGELKVARKGKGKAVTTDREVEEMVSFKEESVEKTELSPDAKSEPSSKSFKTARPDYLTYEPPLEKKAEEKVFRSDLVRPGEHHSVKMLDLLIPTWLATPVTIGRDVYLAGGFTGEVKTVQLVQVYNMDSGDCRTLPPSPQLGSAAVAIDGTLVLIGGYDSSTHKPTNMVSTWMAAEERWTQVLPPMKMKRLRSGVLLLNNHLFVFRSVGVDEKTRLDFFEVLDLNTKQWSEGRGGLPRPLRTPQLGVFGDCVMLYGGWNSDDAATSACYTVPVQVLVDSVTNPLSPPIHWTPVQDAPYYISALLTTSQDAVLIGGYDRHSGDKQVTRAIHRFSSSGSWEVIGELSEPRSGPTVVAVSDRSFLVLGGVSDVNGKPSSSLLKSVELISY